MPFEYIDKAPKKSKFQYIDEAPIDAPKEQGFSQRLDADIDQRAANIERNVARGALGEITPLQSGVNVAGNVAGAGYDVLGNAAGSAYRALPDVKYGLGELGKFVAQSPVGDAGRFVGGKMDEVAQAYPESSEFLGNLLNIVGVAPTAQLTKTVAVKGVDLTGKGLQKVGGAVKQSGIAGELAKKKEFVKDLVMPVQTKKVLEDQASRTTEKGLLKTKVVEPTPLEAASIDEVTNIKGIRKGNSAQANYTLIDKAKNTEAQELGKILKSKDFQINKPMYQQRLGLVVSKLKTDDPFVLGNDAAEKLVDNVAKKMQALLDKNPNTPAGLLKTRQEFDAWAKSNKRSVMESNEGTFANAVRDIRQSANDFLAESVPDAAVKESLRKQSLLFRALDNVEPKTAMEGRNRLQRIAKGVSDAVPIKNPITRGVAQTAGLAGIGAGAYLAPAAAGAMIGLGGLYKLGKAAISPTTRKALGSLTEMTGTALRGGKKLTPTEMAVTAPIAANQAAQLMLPAPDKFRGQPIVSPSFPIDRATSFDDTLQKSFEARKAAKITPTQGISRSDPNYAQNLRSNLMNEDAAAAQTRGALKPSAAQENFEMPLIAKLKASGGVRVGSTLDKELRHMGINPKSMPGLFRKNGGLRDVDRFPENEMGSYGLKVGEAADNGYVNRNTILDAISDEYGFYKKSQSMGVDDAFLNDLGYAADKYNIKTEGKTIQQIENSVNEAVDYERWIVENMNINDSFEQANRKIQKLQKEWIESRGDAWEPKITKQITLDELEKYRNN